MSRKTIYYHDPLHDDFAPTNGHIRPKPIGADFPYEHPSPVWQALAFVVYRLIMTPFLFLYCKLVFDLRIENRKVLRELPGGYFLYGNHTNTLADAFIPTLLAFPRRANIVTAADTVSIPGVRNIVQMLGAVPLADTIDGTRQFLAAIHRRLERRQAVMIYPEAHIWPYHIIMVSARSRTQRLPIRCASRCPPSAWWSSTGSGSCCGFCRRASPSLSASRSTRTHPCRRAAPAGPCIRKSIHSCAIPSPGGTAMRTSNISPHRTHNRPRNDRAARPERWDPAWHI